MTQMTREENGPLDWDMRGGGDCKTGNNLEQPFESIRQTFLLRAPIVVMMMIVHGETKLQPLLYYKPLIQNKESLQKKRESNRKGNDFLRGKEKEMGECKKEHEKDSKGF